MNDGALTNKQLAAGQRQRWRFERLIAVAQSAYNDKQGDLTMCAIEGAWLAADHEMEFEAVIASARFMLDHPIDDLDHDILQDIVQMPRRMELTLSA
jgi:hypothetical protein